jgi:hypothetical protein
MAMPVAFCTACASSWKKNQASKNVVLEAMNRQVNALSKWRTLDFLGLGMGLKVVDDVLRMDVEDRLECFIAHRLSR